MPKHPKIGKKSFTSTTKQGFLSKNPLIGVYKETKGDYGFVDVVEKNGEKKGYYVHFKNKLNAMDGDEVSFSVKHYHGKAEAVVQKILKRAAKIIVGELQISAKGYGFVIPKNFLVKSDIFIPPRYLSGAQNGQIVGVEIISWDAKNPEGKIVYILGEEGDRGIDVFTLAIEGGAKIEFPDQVIQQAKQLSVSPSKDDFIGRKDLRQLFTFTIDGEDAKDLDDAISIEKTKDGTSILYVHIADVSHYVQEKSMLDIEAQERATSIYLTDRVIPMLPEELSNGVCSLNAGEAKLTLTCEMHFSAAGDIQKSSVYESVIESDYRLTYTFVEEAKNKNFQAWDAWIDDSKFEKRGVNKKAVIEGLKKAQQDAKLLEKLKTAFELKKKIELYRKKNGYLEFDFYESKAIIDENGDIIDIKRREKLEANKLIEHFMISANEAVSREFSKYPFLYRIHPEPIPEDVEKAIKIIMNYSKHMHLLANLTRSGFTIENAIALAAGNNFLGRIILRSLTKAIYSDKNEGHFGLGLEYYSHFTSPIRRYPDLQIHRIIKEVLHNKFSQERIAHYKTLLPKVARHSSEREQMSEDIERKVMDLAKAKYMQSKIGQEFEGQISGVIAKGFFVELENTVEGFVDAFSLLMGNFTFLEDSLQLVNFRTKEEFSFGQRVIVKVKDVDIKLRRIDFEFISKIL